MPPASDVSLALRRLQGVLGPKQESAKASRDIRLGLERITRVVPETQEWQGVHVGGTNGKGSICAFLSGLFTLAGISYGRYVSPAFPHKYNSVSINGKHVNPRLYETETRNVENQYQKVLRGWRFASGENPGPLSPFELETATAFRIFNKLRVPYGIVEVGMGGATDATNAMRRKGVTIISKIDLDHQEYLGRTIEEIAKVKAGIMRPGVPCIVDHTNSNSVIKVLRQHASSIGTQISLTWKAESFLTTLDNERWKLEEYQKQNLLCAALAFRHLFPYKEINLDRLLGTEPYLPGRLEWVEISGLINSQSKYPVLVDAAHNLLGVQALSRHVDTNLRSKDEPVTWVIGFSSSKTKPFAEMIETLVRPQDNVAFVEFDQQNNEPPPTPAAHGREVVRSVITSDEQVYQGEPNIRDAVKWAASKAAPGRLVVTGSLYLVRDFYLLEGIHRSRETGAQSPGSSELWRLSELWKQRALTKEEYEEFERAKAQWHHSKKAYSINDIEPNAKQESEGTEASLESTSRKAKKSINEDENPGFAELSKLQLTVVRHERQLKGYKMALDSIFDDIKHEAQDESSMKSETLNKLREDSKLLQEQADKHQTALEYALDEIRNHPDAPRKYCVSHEEIFGRPYKGPKQSPFMERTELDAREEKRNPNPRKEETPTTPAEVQNASETDTDFWGRPIEKPTKVR